MSTTATTAKRKPNCTLPAFRSTLVIETDTGPRRLSQIEEPWQTADFKSIANALHRIVGVPVDEATPIYNRAWLERARGHSKTGDIAVCVAYCLFASPAAFNGVCPAADADQATLVIDAVRRLVRVNPHLSEEVVDPIDRRKKPLIDVQPSGPTLWN